MQQIIEQQRIVGIIHGNQGRRCLYERPTHNNNVRIIGIGRCGRGYGITSGRGIIRNVVTRRKGLNAQSTYDTYVRFGGIDVLREVKFLQFNFWMLLILASSHYIFTMTLLMTIINPKWMWKVKTFTVQVRRKKNLGPLGSGITKITPSLQQKQQRYQQQNAFDQPNKQQIETQRIRLYLWVSMCLYLKEKKSK